MIGPRRREARLRSLLLGAAGGLVVSTAVRLGPSLITRGGLGQRFVPSMMGLGAPGGVALTFDDGPHPEGTPAVLESLRSVGARATFFVVGRQVQRHPGLLARILADGHEVALHGHEHRSHLGRSATSLVRDLRLARHAVAADAGEDVARALRFTRPPFGAVSGGSLWAARRVGLEPVLWTAWGRDWLARSPEEIATTVLDAVRPGGTVLLHDSDAFGGPGSWRATAAAVPVIVERVRQRGLRTPTLSDHLGG